MFAVCQAITLFKISSDSECATRDIVGFRASWIVINSIILGFLFCSFSTMLAVTDVNYCRAAVHGKSLAKNQSVIYLKKVLSQNHKANEYIGGLIERMDFILIIGLSRSCTSCYWGL